MWQGIPWQGEGTWGCMGRCPHQKINILRYEKFCIRMLEHIKSSDVKTLDKSKKYEIRLFSFTKKATKIGLES